MSKTDRLKESIAMHDAIQHDMITNRKIMTEIEYNASCGFFSIPKRVMLNNMAWFVERLFDEKLISKPEEAIEVFREFDKALEMYQTELMNRWDAAYVYSYKESMRLNTELFDLECKEKDEDAQK